MKIGIAAIYVYHNLPLWKITENGEKNAKKRTQSNEQGELEERTTEQRWMRINARQAPNWNHEELKALPIEP